MVTELYLNYDCDVYCSNLFEDLTKLLSKVGVHLYQTAASQGFQVHKSIGLKTRLISKTDRCLF